MLRIEVICMINGFNKKTMNVFGSKNVFCSMFLVVLLNKRHFSVPLYFNLPHLNLLFQYELS